MEPDESYHPGSSSVCDDPESRTAVNSLILDYYKKFGRKRDLEQYFSLSTAQSEIRDPSSLFWRRMKAQHDSSDSGDKPSESSTELCRISIKCSVPEQSTSSTTQESAPKPKFESESPPIIIEDLVPTERLSDDESVKSEGNHSLKSADATLDTSLNKPHSPTSSVTSQRKLEWDSLADVGYANESDRKTSGSSLSTLERLALLQQYTNSDNKENSNLGQPSAHSTLLDVRSGPKKTNKKNLVKKTTEIHQRDIDTVEVNVPYTSGNMPISVNLTKHISFNVEKDGGIVVESNDKEIVVNPEEKVLAEAKMLPEVRFDKQIQTSFTKSTTETSESNNNRKAHRNETGPVLISLNTIRQRIKRRKRRKARKKTVTKKQSKTKSQDRQQQKSAEQVSEAESFEYMPGHIYNQNQMKDGHHKTKNSAGNKSSLESSGGITTESSKSYSFTKDLEKSIKVLNEVLQRHNDDSNLKKKLVKEIVRKLVKSDYRDDESATEFLSGLSYNSKRLDLSKASQSYTTTSTSEANNSGDTSRRPKKSILRMEKFDSKALATNSQSAPNLPSVSTSEVQTKTILAPLMNLESDVSVDKSFIKTSSEEIYQKYLEALRKEEAYKKHLQDKDKFLKQKLVGSDSAIRAPEVQIPVTKPNKLKDLIKDLIRNNYDDGSGDASKLEGGPSFNSQNCTSNSDIRKQRNHSVFTLSSGNSDQKCLDRESRKINLRKRLQEEIQAGSSSNEGTSKAALRKEHYCCCPHHTSRCGFTDSSTQVNVDHCQGCDKRKMMPSTACHCKIAEDMGSKKVFGSEKPGSPRKYEVQYKVHKSSDFDTHKEFEKCSKDSFDGTFQCSGTRNSPRGAISKNDEHIKPSTSQTNEFIDVHPHKALRAGDEVIFEKWGELTGKTSQSSQTNIDINIFPKKHCNQFCDCNNPMCTRKSNLAKSFTATDLPQALNNAPKTNMVHETTRCLQTEISIDPKISDPQLRDIVIVNSNDLVQIISEHYREVSRSKFSDTTDVEVKYLRKFKNSETQFETDNDLYTYLSPRVGASDKSRTTRCGTYTAEPYNERRDGSFVINRSQSNTESVKQSEDFRSPSDFKLNTESYAIPLEGTNMTLRVSIGTKDGKNKIKDPEPKKEAGTSPANIEGDAFGSLSDRSSSKASTPHSKVEKSATTDACCGGTKNSQQKYPTYPSVPKKQMIRTNTDLGLLEKKAIQIEPVREPEKQIRDVDIQANIPTKEKNVQNSIDQQQPTTPVPKSVTETDCTECAKPKGFGTSSKCHACGKGLEERVQEKKVGKPIEDAPCKCQAEPINAKKSKDVQGIQVSAEVISENRDGTGIAERSQKGSGAHSECNSYTSSLEKKSDEPKEKSPFKSRGADLETAASLPLSARSTCSDPVMEKIQEITKRYGKKDLDKGRRKKCFNEIIAVLNYLLETEDKAEFRKQECAAASSNDTSEGTATSSGRKGTQDTSTPTNTLPSKCNKESSSPSSSKKVNKESSTPSASKKLINRAIQLTQRKPRIKQSSSDSSEIPTSSDIQECNTDATTCKILNHIKKECEKYHKRCKSLHHNAKCDSSSTSVQCGDCKKTPHCRAPKCKCKTKTASAFQRLKKKCVAYNLILQTSESMISDAREKEIKRELKNIVVKVPPRCCKPLPEYQSYLPHKFEQAQTKAHRPKSSNEEVPATDDYKQAHGLSVREYLEKNRPDFIESTSQRQNCLKMMEEQRASERELRRRLLSLQLERQQALKGVSASQLRQLARELGFKRSGESAPKFISEREMKKHSKKIYKKLPEQMRKKEEQRNDNVKKTNLLMASIFKKNLQKQTLRGSVNLSNYNTVIKI